MSPLKRYKKFNLFPTWMILDILLVLLVTYQIYEICNERVSAER